MTMVSEKKLNRGAEIASACGPGASRVSGSVTWRSSISTAEPRGRPTSRTPPLSTAAGELAAALSTGASAGAGRGAGAGAGTAGAGSAARAVSGGGTGAATLSAGGAGSGAGGAESAAAAVGPAAKPRAW
jgi:hypothetical protein